MNATGHKTIQTTLIVNNGGDGVNLVGKVLLFQLKLDSGIFIQDHFSTHFSEDEDEDDAYDDDGDDDAIPLML